MVWLMYVAGSSQKRVADVQYIVRLVRVQKISGKYLVIIKIVVPQQFMVISLPPIKEKRRGRSTCTMSLPVPYRNTGLNSKRNTVNSSHLHLLSITFALSFVIISFVLLSSQLSDYFSSQLSVPSARSVLVQLLM